MRFLIFDPSNGKVLCAVESQSTIDELIALGNHAIASSEPMNSVYVDVQNRALVKLPEAPSAYHDFDYAEKRWVANDARAWAEVRGTRDRLLGLSDWRVTKALDTGTPMGDQWAAYRQALRDVTSQPDPFNITWPVAPV